MQCKIMDMLAVKGCNATCSVYNAKGPAPSKAGETEPMAVRCNTMMAKLRTLLESTVQVEPLA